MIDICCCAFLACHAACGDREYDRMLVLPPERIATELAARGGAPVPSVAVFLAAAATPIGGG